MLRKVVNRPVDSLAFKVWGVSSPFLVLLFTFLQTPSYRRTWWWPTTTTWSPSPDHRPSWWNENNTEESARADEWFTISGNCSSNGIRKKTHQSCCEKVSNYLRSDHLTIATIPANSSVLTPCTNSNRYRKRKHVFVRSMLSHVSDYDVIVHLLNVNQFE